MEATQQDKDLIQQVSECMQAGPSRVEELNSLFAADAVLIEPFSGPVQTSVGIDAISARNREMVNAPRPPDFKITIDQIASEGGKVVTDWTCTSVVLPAPMKGRSDYTIRSGKIAKLEIAFLP